MVRWRSAAGLLLLLLAGTAARASAAGVFTRLPDAAAPSYALRAGAAGPRRAAAMIAVDESALEAFRAARGGAIDVPSPDGGSVTLELEPYDLFAPGAGPTFTDAGGRHPLLADVTLFRGRVAGEDGSWAVVAMGPQGVFGSVRRRDGTWSLSPTAVRARGAAMPAHAFAPDEALAATPSPFTCGVDESNEARLTVPLATPPAGGPLRPNGPAQVEINAARSVFKLAVDCDYEIYATKFAGNLDAATAYILTVLGTVNLIYERDLEVTLQLSYLNLWTVPNDPYTASTTSDELTEMQAYWQANNGGVDRAIAHLISGRALGGGIAYINALCSNSAGYGLSAIDASYTYPTNTTTWDIEVIAHEIGHNFGSWHTHSCAWAANGFLPANTTIDTCQASEGGCVNAPNHLPPDKGTIMSYCHLIATVATGIRLDFHPICIQRMRQVIGSAACRGTPVVAPPRNPQIAATATGAHLSWTASSSTGVLSYDVLASRTQLDLAPAKIGSVAAPATAFDVTGLGLYYYRVRAVRAADTSATSAELKYNVCNFATPGNLASASQPSAAVTGDWNGDGLTDLAVVNAGANVVSIYLGLGSGGIGNGDFAPAVTVPTGQRPACLAADDVTGDGIPDLIVGCQTDNTVVVHAGAGDGTFAAGVAYPAGVAVSGLAVADFDEDGLDDVAVAGGSTQVQILRGQGADGVPNGAFSAPAPVAAGITAVGLIEGDWNGDGVRDLAVSGSGVSMLLGNGVSGHGDGTFAAPIVRFMGSTPNQMACGDFNLDGHLDLVVCNNSGTSASVLLGNGDGTLQSPIAAPSGTNPTGVAVADWNDDGVPDLAVANNTSARTASVMLGRGDGTFEAAQPFPAGTGPSFVAASDFNRDGGVDLVVLNKSGLSLTRMLATCTSSLGSALAVSAPAGGEQWIGGEERTIGWSRGAGVMAVDVQLSRDGGTHWRTIADHVPGTSFAWTVTGPYTTHARVRVVDSVRPQFADTTHADFTIIPLSALAVPPGQARFALLGAFPNPSRGDVAVSFALPAEGPATLELVDLAGRRVAAREVGSLGPGEHRAALVPAGAARPGLYWIRLTRGGETRSLKLAVIR